MSPRPLVNLSTQGSIPIVSAGLSCGIEHIASSDVSGMDTKRSQTTYACCATGLLKYLASTTKSEYILAGRHFSFLPLSHIQIPSEIGL
jgi:hypothetical protein